MVFFQRSPTMVRHEIHRLCKANGLHRIATMVSLKSLQDPSLRFKGIVQAPLSVLIIMTKMLPIRGSQIVNKKNAAITILLRKLSKIV